MSNLALFLHLTGALAFVAGIVLAGAAFEGARRRERAAEVVLLLGLARVGAVLVAGGGLLLLGGGLWLVGLESDVGFGTGWVDVSLALFALVVVLGTLGGRRPRHARELAERLAGEGRESSPELRALLDDPASRLANYASALLVLAILALMVFKP
ncbi:MAG: DUF2269 family protein [Chloroflexota bacterium]